MQFNSTSTTDCLVYPGEYALLPEVKSRLSELKAGWNESLARLPVNINEFPDCYRIEAGISVASREEIMIDITNNILSIIVLRKTIVHEDPKREVLQIHEFSDEPLERHIELPVDANVEFTSAQFTNGILRIDIPKDYQQTSTNSVRIVVY